jgi:hypothetical protein
MHVQMSSSSAMVWKRQADEHAQSARMLTRVSIGLLVAMTATGAYAYSNHNGYGRLCAAIERQAAVAQADAARQLGRELAMTYCR